MLECLQLLIFLALDLTNSDMPCCLSETWYCDDNGPLKFAIANIGEPWLKVSLSFLTTALKKQWFWLASPWSFPLSFMAFKGYLQSALTSDSRIHSWTSTYYWKEYSENYLVERLRFGFERIFRLEDSCKLLCSLVLFVKLKLYFQKVTTLAPPGDSSVPERCWEPANYEPLLGRAIFSEQKIISWKWNYQQKL